MAGDFDDHATVVVLEEVVRRLVQIDIVSAPDSRKRLAEWLAFLKERSGLYQEAAWGDREPVNATMHAIRIAAEFDQFAEELTGQL